MPISPQGKASYFKRPNEGMPPVGVPVIIITGEGKFKIPRKARLEQFKSGGYVFLLIGDNYDAAYIQGPDGLKLYGKSVSDVSYWAFFPGGASQ